MSSTLIQNAIVVRPGLESVLGSVLLREGKIVEFDPVVDELPQDVDRIDAEGALLSPGLVDLHVHGIQAFLFERDPEDLVAGAAVFPQYGVTCALPTLYRVLDRRSLSKLEHLSNLLASTAGADMPGFHLEGPFLALPGAGADTVPGDIVLLEELLSATRGRVCAMSVSPDCPHVLPVIEHLRERGIAVFLTHTRASVAQTQAAIDAGARHATHFYDVFPLPEETEPGVRPVGIVETVLADRRCTVDFICDGVHVDPMAIRLALAAKGWPGVVAISDGNIGAGLDDGVYPTPWGFSVKVSRHDAARVHDVAHPLHGQLAGSSLTMNRALANLFGWLERPAHEIWAMGTSNPARVAGLNTKGIMEVGADADLVLWEQHSSELKPIRTWVRGELVYECEPALA